MLQTSVDLIQSRCDTSLRYKWFGTSLFDTCQFDTKSFRCKVVLIHSRFDTSRLDTSFFSQVVNSFMSLTQRMKKIYPKYISCSAQTTLSWTKFLGRFHLLSWCQNDFVSKWPVFPFWSLMLKSFKRKITLFEGAIRDSQVFSLEEVNSEFETVHVSCHILLTLGVK